MPKEDEVARLLRKLRERAEEEDEDIVLAGPARAGRIAAIEKALGVKLPPSYRWFLEQYGAGCCTADADTYAFLGASDDGAYDVVGATLGAREERGLSKDLVLVVEGGDDGLEYCLDCSSPRPDGECPIVSIEEDGNEPVDHVFATFTEMLVHGLRCNAGLPPED